MDKKEFIKEFTEMWFPLIQDDVDIGEWTQHLTECLDQLINQVKEEEYKRGYDEGFRIGNY